MPAYNGHGNLEDLISDEEFAEVKAKLSLPENLTLSDITTFLKYGDPIVIGLGGSAASGKTTTGMGIARMLTYIGRPGAYIKFPTRDRHFGKKLYERLNYREGRTGQYPNRGDNVLCSVLSADWEDKSAEVLLNGFGRKARVEIPQDKGGRLYGVKGIFLERLLNDYKEAKRKGRDLLQEVFCEGASLVCTVDSVDRLSNEIWVTPRRWKKSSFLKDSLYMLLNFFEKRPYIKRCLREGYHVILDRGTEMEWSIAPPELANSYMGIWFEELLRKISRVGKRVNMSHIISPETGMKRLDMRMSVGEAEEQDYDTGEVIKRTRWNQIKSYLRRKKKTMPRRDLSHLETIEDLAEEARRLKEKPDVTLYWDGQSDVIVDTGSASKRFVATAGITMAGIAAAAPFLRKVIESIIENY